MAIWIPGYEQKYNHPLDPAITIALGRSTVVFQAPEAVKHPGFPSSQGTKQTHDVLLANVDSRPVYVIRPGYMSSNVVQDLANKRAAMNGG